MKIDKQNNELINNIKQSKKAKISNSSKIFMLLEEQYNFPLRTLIQEYLSNGKDSCVRAKNDVKIEITLPTYEEPSLRIRDYGTGMDDKDIEDIFFNYGESLAEMTNDNIGGWGVGGKSVFAYTDFVLVNGFKDKQKWEYQGFKTESNETEYLCLSKTKTKEKNGVEIIINMEETAHIVQVIQYIYRATSLWSKKDRPIIINKDYHTKLISKNDNLDQLVYVEDKLIKVLKYNPKCFNDLEDATFILNIGGVPYGIDTSELDTEDVKVVSKINALISEYVKIIIDGEIGAVNFPVSREFLKYSKKTLSYLKVKLKAVLLSLESLKQKKLDEVNSLSSVLQLKDNPVFVLSKIKKRGKGYNITFKWDVSPYGHYSDALEYSINSNFKYIEIFKRGQSGVSQVESTNLSFLFKKDNIKNILYVINDCEEEGKSMIRRRLVSEIDKRPGFYKGQILWSLKSRHEECHEGIVLLPSSTNSDFLDLIKKYFKVVKLSSFTLPESEPRVKGVPRIKDSAFKYVQYGEYPVMQSIQSSEFDYKNIVYIKKNGVGSIKDKDGFSLDKEDIELLNRKSKVKIVGVSQAQFPKLDKKKVKFLDKISLNKLLNNEDSIPFFIDEYFSHDFDLFRSLDSIKIDKTLDPFVSTYIKYGELFCKSGLRGWGSSDLKKYHMLISRLSGSKKFKKEIEELIQHLKQEYPLLQFVEHYNVKKEPILDYVKLRRGREK